MGLTRLRYVIPALWLRDRIPGGDYRAKIRQVAEIDSALDENTTQMAWFVFDCQIQALDPEAVAAALELHQAVTRMPVPSPHIVKERLE